MRFKDLYDQDKDGKLNREEQLRWVAPNSYGSAREEVSLLCSNMCLWRKDQLTHTTSIKDVVKPLKSQNISIASWWWFVVKVTPI